MIIYGDKREHIFIIVDGIKDKIIFTVDRSERKTMKMSGDVYILIAYRILTCITGKLIYRPQFPLT